MNASGTRTRGVIGDGARALRVDVGAIADHAIALHGLTGRAAALVTDGLTCAALLSAYLDDGERLTLQVQASSPRFAFTADVSSDGGVRARFTPGSVPEDPVIEGVMLVLKSVVGREVYRGATAVSHGSFEAMLSDHLTRSDQVEAVVRIREGIGSFVERLPDGTDEDLAPLAEGVLLAFEGEADRLFWSCSCSRDRVLRMLHSLGTAEIEGMLEDGGAVITCHFCTNEVVVDSDELHGLLKRDNA